jgi:two-component system chemotaxis sensor kinase CheA
MRVILFRALCGERRAIAMSAVEQVERAPSASVRSPGPDAQIVIGEEILPLAGVPEGAELPEQLVVLRLGDGGEPIAYAASEVLDIATLSGVLKRVNGKPTVVGVTLVDGETAELVDCHALFASHATHTGRARSLTCRLDGEDGWMKNFLGPIIEAAGYRVVDGDEPADIAFVDPTTGEDAPGDARKAIRLHNEPGNAGGADSIYRYDRAALMAALLRAGEELAA